MLLKWLSLVYTMAAATTPTSCHASNTDPTTNIDGTPHDTLEAMVFSCSPSVLLQGRSGTSSTVTSNIILGGAERKRSAMVNVTAAKARAYNEGYNKNGMQEGGGGGGNDDHKEEAVQEVEEVDQDMAMEDDNTNNGCLMYSRRGQKRRLSPEQVRCLERSFEVENKLEGERKLQLAMELHLHPRQVSVWFQNRRARWKTKQLEKDYDALKLSFTTLQAHFDALLHHKQELLREVMFLRTKQHAGPDHGSKATNEEELIKAEEKSKEIHGGGQKLRMPSVDIIIHGEIQEKMSASRVDMKQGDGGGELLKAEVSALSSGTEGSAVSEAINSPHAIDSGDVDSKENIFDHGAAGAAANIMATVDNQCIISSCAAAASCAAIKTASGDHLSTIISPQIVAFDPIMQQNAENYSNNSYCSFFLEDDEGAFPWWSSTL